MEFEAAAWMARQLMRTYGVGDWTFAWNRRKRSLGLCRYRVRRIELSAHFVQANDETQVRETVLHEIAHALAGEKAGHGPRWKAMCLRVGCKPERCDDGQAVMPPGRWNARCGSCGKEFSRHRRPARRARYWCRRCGPYEGGITFTQAGEPLAVSLRPGVSRLQESRAPTCSAMKTRPAPRLAKKDSPA